ncbi:hypothetical protein QBC40DRAFT_277438 [Triangularia verruculosa]|uniref:Uncharacterized protein n=1 Tax=Triangularia verruculosa TaxID=2587418 RepID=A0AAN6XJG1_9PEZI|nr:hypothetical protein QBC40DRAFT_277438 [Triangularia verruculosa]
MPSFTAKAAAVALAVSYVSVQQVQCPPIFLSPIITAITAGATFVIEVTGAVVACELEGCTNEKRRDLSGVRARMLKARPILTGRQATAPTAPEGVPQQEFDLCFADANGKTIDISGPVENNGIRVTGLPASCMNLAAVLDGDTSGGPPPVSCGSDCLLYDNLSAEDFNNLRVTFNGLSTL